MQNHKSAERFSRADDSWMFDMITARDITTNSLCDINSKAGLVHYRDKTMTNVRDTK